MGNKLPYTPNGKIRSALRIVWMRSRERSTALRNTGYCCSACGVKQSTAKGKEVKLDVHHTRGQVNWEKIFKVLREELLCDPEHLAPLCRKCHDELDEHVHLKKTD